MSEDSRNWETIHLICVDGVISTKPFSYKAKQKGLKLLIELYTLDKEQDITDTLAFMVAVHTSNSEKLRDRIKGHCLS